MMCQIVCIIPHGTQLWFTDNIEICLSERRKSPIYKLLELLLT